MPKLTAEEKTKWAAGRKRRAAKRREAIASATPRQTKGRPKTAKQYRQKGQSAYSRLQADEELGYCGAKTKEGGSCRMRAGVGTDHPGFGRCKHHGGYLSTHKAQAAKHHAVEFMGAPKDITPIQAIIWCIRITAGEIEFLSQELAKITNEELWYEDTISGKQMHVLQRCRADAQDRLVGYSKTAIGLGLAERSIRLAEQFGATIAKLLEGIKSELQLNKAQQNMWPTIVRRHLILLEGRNEVPVIEGRAERVIDGDSNGSAA